jgi:hypothetical protein
MICSVGPCCWTRSLQRCLSVVATYFDITSWCHCTWVSEIYQSQIINVRSQVLCIRSCSSVPMTKNSRVVHIFRTSAREQSITTESGLLKVVTYLHFVGWTTEGAARTFPADRQSQPPQKSGAAPHTVASESSPLPAKGQLKPLLPWEVRRDMGQFGKKKFQAEYISVLHEVLYIQIYIYGKLHCSYNSIYIYYRYVAVAIVRGNPNLMWSLRQG